MFFKGIFKNFLHSNHKFTFLQFSQTYKSIIYFFLKKFGQLKKTFKTVHFMNDTDQTIFSKIDLERPEYTTYILVGND